MLILEDRNCEELLSLCWWTIRICCRNFLLRLEYSLDGSSNYIAWKGMMEVELDDNGLKEFIDSDVPMPASSDVAGLDAWKRR